MHKKTRQLTNRYFLKEIDDKIAVLYENDEEVTSFKSVDMTYVVTWLKSNILNVDIIFL